MGVFNRSERWFVQRVEEAECREWLWANEVVRKKRGRCNKGGAQRGLLIGHERVETKCWGCVAAYQAWVLQPPPYGTLCGGRSKLLPSHTTAMNTQQNRVTMASLGLRHSRGL
ncbi:hypothetical protein E2C01_070370 [Portunus trituberculatus]|uniref:Uncharacterized protein n=1 Tax=Portunus trituberculatus TaxID=210409 RepID=A0A5B7I230_PORTR|nr:hypothetical protein [Portunus trituberculatus]